MKSPKVPGDEQPICSICIAMMKSPAEVPEDKQRLLETEYIPQTGWSDQRVKNIHTHTHHIAIPTTNMYTMEPLNKGQVGDIFLIQLFLSFVALFRRYQSYMTLCTNFGTLICVLCREVYSIVFLSRKVHFQRFYCRLQGLFSAH